MANETKTFLSSFNKYIFTPQPSEGIFANRPYKWAITIHDATNDPRGVTLDSTWHQSSGKRKSIAVVLSWAGINDDFTQGIRNNSTISFNYVPSGETWTIQYYIVWGIASVNDNDVYYPIYAGEFEDPVVLEELQILQFPVNTFRIIP